MEFSFFNVVGDSVIKNEIGRNEGGYLKVTNGGMIQGLSVLVSSAYWWQNEKNHFSRSYLQLVFVF